MYWLSARTRNDLFLLYCFTDTDRPTADLRVSVAERSATIADLRVRARNVPRDLDYPAWVRCDFAANQFIEHVLPEPNWAHLQTALGELTNTGVNAADRPWRLHVFRGIVDAPAPMGPALGATDPGLPLEQGAGGLTSGQDGPGSTSAEERGGSALRSSGSDLPLEQGLTPEPDGPGCAGQKRVEPALGATDPGIPLEQGAQGLTPGRDGSGSTAGQERMGSALGASGSGFPLEQGDVRFTQEPDDLGSSPGQDDSGPALVVVLQMSHALADGRRAAEIARTLFAAANLEAAPKSVVGAPRTGRLPGARALTALVTWAGSLDAEAVESRPTAALSDSAPSAVGLLKSTGADPILRLARRARALGLHAFDMGSAARIGHSAVRVPTGSVMPSPVAVALALPLLPIRLARTAVRGYQAFRAQRELAERTAAGELPPPGPDFPPCLVNQAAMEANSSHQVRMIVCEAAALRVPGRTVTVVVLTAVSLALARYLDGRGGSVRRLGAQVPMALSATATPNARNNYRSLSVDLFIDEPDLRLRADKIAATMADRRVRAQHPLLTAQDRVTAVVPAPLLRRDIARYPLDTVPDAIAGHTVVSSVHRGPANLTFGGGRVRFTGGFPAIGSVMRLTHGVHGLGDTVTISLHADAATVPDLDAYTELLRAALNEAARTLK